MRKRILSALLSISLLSAQFVAVHADNLLETQLPTNTEQTVEYCTDRFIVEMKADMGISLFSTEENDISEEDIEIGINDVLSDLETVSDTANVSDVVSIEENSSVVTLSEEIDAAEFARATKDVLGDNVTVQPDYPVYMAQSVNTDEISATADTTTPDPTSTPQPKWLQSLEDAKTLSTGEGVRIAILGEHFPFRDYSATGYDYIVDGYNITNASYSTYNDLQISDMQMVSIIHNAVPDAKIIPISVFTKISDVPNPCYEARSMAYTSDIVKAIHHAQNKGAQAVVCRWYSTSYNAYLEEQMNNANMLFIASAGHHSTFSPDMEDLWSGNLDEEPIYPACYNIDNLITISSIDDNYNRNVYANYGSDVVYTWGNEITTYPEGQSYADISSGPEAATALAAGVAALVIDRNNSADNLKNILLQSATTINYMPGTRDFESYKILDYCDAINNVVSDKEIEVSIPRDDGSYNFDYSGNWSNTATIFYGDIKDIASGMSYIAILMGDGTVKMAYLSSNPAGSHPFSLLKSTGNFVTVPGLNNIKKIALSPSGSALCAVDNDGKLFVWGQGHALGMNTNKYIEFPTENTSVSGVQDVYMTLDTTWVRTKDENGDIKVYSTGKAIFREGTELEFGEVMEAEGATYISIDNSSPSKPCAAFIKGGKVYVSNNMAGVTNEDTYFTELPQYSSNNKEAIISNYSYSGTLTYGICVLNNDGFLQEIHNEKSLLNSTVYNKDYNVEDIVEISGKILAKKQDSGYCVDFITTPYDPIGLPSNGKIVSSAALKSNSNVNGYYILFEDGSMYFNPCESLGNVYDSGRFTLVAQKNFDAHTVHSIVPVDITVEYGEEMPGIDEILEEHTQNRATITLDDGTDVSVPVQWDTSGYTQNQLGKQTITGTPTLPENITKPEEMKAQANVIIRAPITDVKSLEVKVDYNTPLSDIEQQLANEVTVTLSNGTTETLPVEWDTSPYNQTQSGEQKIYGTVKIDGKNKDKISNPYNKRAMTTVTVGNPPDPSVTNVHNPNTITVPYDTDVTELEKQLPPQVEVDLDNETTAVLNVTWDISEYDSKYTEDLQTLNGTLSKLSSDQKVNIKDKTASVKVEVAPEITGNIISSAMIGIEAEQCVPFEQIADVPNFVEVTVEDNRTTTLPVEWHPEGIENFSEPYNPDIASDKPQYVYGTIITNEKITNTNLVKAVLSVKVNSASYEMESILPAEADIEVEYGTTIEKVEEQFKAMQETVTVNAKNIKTREVLPLERKLKLSESNPSFNPEDTTTTQDLVLEVVWPDGMEIQNKKTFTLHVKVHEKRNITSVPFITLQAHLYEPVSQLNIPKTLTLALDNGEAAVLEVDWDTEDVEFNEPNKTYIIKGKYVNIPPHINCSPTYDPIIAVYVENTFYEITSISKKTYSKLNAGLELNELYDSMEPKYVTAVLTATDNSGFKISKDIEFTIDEEKTMGSRRPYNPEVAGPYTLYLNLDLPTNVSYNKTVSLNIQTRKVSIDPDMDRTIEPIIVPSNTTFEELNLPDEITVNLTNNKSITVTIQWDETTYKPVQDSKCTVSGKIVNIPKYVNPTDKPFTCEISFTAPAAQYEIESIVSNPVPSMRVPLGTTISQLNEMIKDKTVEVKLKGQEENVGLRFKFTDADNPSYSTEVADTYELKAQLILQNNISNPNNIMLPVSVEVYEQTISDVLFVDYEEAVGKPVYVNTEFTALELPETVTVVTTDGEEISNIPVTWNPDSYDPTLADVQYIEGEVQCPPYLKNPDEIPAWCIINVQEEIEGQVLSMTPVEEISMFSLRSAPIIREQPQKLLNKVKKQRYIVEYLNADGNISTKEITLVDIIR